MAADTLSAASAGVLELVDRHGSGPCARKSVEVRLLSPASFHHPTPSGRDANVFAVTHPPDRIAEVVDLGQQGVSATEISRRSGIARETVRDWLAGRTPRSSRRRAGSCERCGGPGHRFADLPAAYPYLLGLYLGDG